MRDVAPFCVRVGDRSSVACVSVSTYLRSEAKGRTRAVGRGMRGVPRGLLGRNRMTEGYAGSRGGGDDCQNRAARRYEKCSYLWHYFRRFEPFRPSLLPPTRLANRFPVPLFLSSRSPSPHPRPDLLLYVPLPPSFRETHVGSYFLSSARRCAPPYPLSTPPCPLSSSPPDRFIPVGRGPHHMPDAHSGARSPPPPRAPL